VDYPPEDQLLARQAVTRHLRGPLGAPPEHESEEPG
jgi:hypothetical protein